jgi:hypothetical protein
VFTATLAGTGVRALAVTDVDADALGVTGIEIADEGSLGALK